MSFLPEAVSAYNEILVRGFTAVEQRDLLTKLQQIILNMSAVGPDMGDRFGLLPSQFVSDLTTNRSSNSAERRITEKEENI